MSNFTPGAKFKVSGLFKAAYRWLRDESEPVQPGTLPPMAPAPAGPPPPTAKPPPSSPKPGSSAATPAAHAPNGECLHLPLQPVLDTLPAELKSKLQERSVGQMTIPVPVAKIVAQLPLGVVKITFGELRQAAPHVFAPTADADNALVSLPLSEILPRLGAAKLTRRADQKVVEVPEEVTSPFGARGKGLVISAAPEKSSSTTHQTAAQPPNPIVPGNSVPPTATPPAFQRGMTPAAPSAPAAPALPARAIVPAAPAHPPMPTSPPKPVFPPAATPAAPASPPFTAHPLKQPAANGGNGSNGSNGKGTPLPSFAPRPTSPPAAAPAPASNPPPASTETLEVPLLSLMNAWPQAIRLEIAQMNLMDAKVVFPVAVLEKGLRQGKVEFPWKLVRAWIRPELPPQASPSDGVALDLPLSVVAPLFIARRKPAAKAQRKVAVDETIPNLFFGFPQAEGAPGFGNAAPVSAPVAAKSADTNFYALRDYDEEKAQAEKQAAATPPTDFLKRGATPNELVTRATSLPGVAGALVALPDGLAVASRVPATYNSDTLAAFLPQIFGKVSQCTAELRMGSLNNLNFTVGNVPWKIFRVNNVFFAAFGRAEEPLPTSQLAALAAELDRKPKAT